MKEPKEKGRLFLFFLTNLNFLLSINIFWTLLIVLQSYLMHQWLWFSRGGSVIVILGAIMSARNTLRLTSEERIRMRNMTIIEEFTESEKGEQETDSKALLLGVVCMLIGTLIWAYGDLLNDIVKYRV